MSAFGDYNKDFICESIIDFIRESNEEKISVIIKDIIEAVSYGLEHGISEFERRAD